MALDLDFFDIVDQYESNIYDDNEDFSRGIERFSEELEDISDKKVVIKNITDKSVKIPLCILQPERNILNPDVRKKVQEELMMSDMKHVTAPKIFIITASGDVTGIKFNEYQHMNFLIPTEDIPIIKSNCGELRHENYYIFANIKKSNRGRTKKETKKKSVENLKSQITFCVRRPEIEKSNQLIKHKLFRSGNIQISGLTYDDIDQAQEMVQKIINLISGTDLVAPGEEVKMTSLCAIMENYKFNIILRRKESINLSHFKREIDNNSHLLDAVNDTKEEISLLYVSYDGSKAAMKMVLYCPSIQKKKKTLITNVFSTSKVNILGCCGIRYARVISKFLNAVLMRSRERIIIYNRDCLWTNYRLIKEAKNTESIDEYEPTL